MEFELMKQQLTGEYREIFSAAWIYGSMKNVPEDTLTDRLTELYDILLTAQTEGREARRVAGSDTERFCRDFFGDLTAAERIKQLPERVYRWAWAVFVIELSVLTIGEGGKLSTVTNVVPYLFGVGVGILFELLCRFVIVPLMFTSRSIKPETWNSVALLGFAAMIFGSVTFQKHVSAALTVPTLPLVIGCGAYIAVFFAARAAWRYKNFGTILNERKRLLRDSYYRDLGSGDLEKTVLKTWKKQYERLAKKGKTASGDFLEKVRKDERLSSVADKGYTVFCAVLYVCMVVSQAANTQSVGETAFYAVIIGFVIYGMWRFFLRAFRMGSAARKKLIRDLESSGLGVTEYIDERLSEES